MRMLLRQPPKQLIGLLRTFNLHISQKSSTFVCERVCGEFLLDLFVCTRFALSLYCMDKQASTYRITRAELQMLQRVAEVGKSAIDSAMLSELMSLTGVRVRNIGCGQCWMDAAMQCYNVIKKAGYEVSD